MKTLRWIGGFITAVAVVLVGGWLYADFGFLHALYFAYPTRIFLGALALILLISGFCFLEIILNRRTKLKEAFEVFKPVKKLTPEDLHITNYDAFYIERKSDKDVEDLLSQRKYVFITGIPMLGKTRMAYEAVKKLQGFSVLKPVPKKINMQALRLPLLRKRIILFLDDLNKFVGKFDLDLLIAKLKKRSKDFVVVATCRSGKEFDQVFAEKEMENLLTQCRRYERRPRRLNPGEEEALAASAGRDLGQIVSDGTPGSITIDLRYMKHRYGQLGDEQSVLRCLKLLREGNIFIWTEDLVQQISHKIFDLDIGRTKWDLYVESLTSSGFITKAGKLIFVLHDIYLDDRFMDEFIVSDVELSLLKEELFELKDSTNLLNLGICFYRRKSPGEALECYHKCIHIKPDFAQPHYDMGILFEDLKRYKEAEREYREALRIDPEYVMAHNNLGILLKDLERHEEAEKEYREALRIKPDYAYPHGNLGNLLNDLKRYEEAEKEYRELLRINPDDVKGHNNLGSLLEKVNRHEEAQKEYEEALRIDPDYAPAHNNLATKFQELGKYNEAESEYKEALRIDPDYADAHSNLGILLHELGRYDEAEKEFKEALRINPEHAKAHYNLGNLLDDSERHDEAEKEYREALSINSEYAEAHSNLAMLLLSLNRKDEAKKELAIAHNLFKTEGRNDDAKKAERFLKEL